MMLPETPLVSVIIPAYQAANTLGRTLDSALQQDYPNFEIIVVDDGSTDATRQVAAEAAARDTRVQYYWQANRGQATARNVAVEHSNGEYLAFLDDDDEWRPGKLQLQVDILSHHDSVDIVFTNSLAVEAATGRTRLWSERHARVIGSLDLQALPGHEDVFIVSVGPLRLAVFRFGLIHFSSVMMRRAVFERLGGLDPRRHGTEDVDLHGRATRVAGFAYCAQALSIQNLGQWNASRPSEKWYQEIIRHHQLALASPEYADLHGEARRLLRARYRWLIFYHGRHWQPRLAWAALRRSREAGFDGLSILCALGAWLGPLPFMIAGRLLWPKS